MDDSAAWRPAPQPNDLFARIGPLLRRRRGDGWAYALRVETAHRNGSGLMHGGAMTALIDEVVGTVVADAVGRPHVTVQMSMSFFAPVRVGDLVEVDCAIVRRTRSMAFVEARLRVGAEAVATASLVFKAPSSAVDGQGGGGGHRPA